MSNPFMAALGGGQMPMGNFAQMVQQFNQFKANFKGDPKADAVIININQHRGHDLMNKNFSKE